MGDQSMVATRQAPLRRIYTEDGEQAITVKRVRTVEAPTTDAWHGTVDAVDYPTVQWDRGIDAKVGGYDDLPNPGSNLDSSTCDARSGSKQRGESTSD